MNTTTKQHKETEVQMQTIAKLVKASLPEDWAFILIASPVGENKNCNYVATMERKCAINVMKEFLIKCGAAEDWMKRIE